MASEFDFICRFVSEAGIRSPAAAVPNNLDVLRGTDLFSASFVTGVITSVSIISCCCGSTHDVIFDL